MINVHLEHQKLVRFELDAQLVHYLKIGHWFAGLDRGQRYGDLHFSHRLEVQAVWQVKRCAVGNIFYALDVDHLEKVWLVRLLGFYNVMEGKIQKVILCFF